MQREENLRKMKMLMMKDKMNLILSIMKTPLATNLFDLVSDGEPVRADGA